MMIWSILVRGREPLDDGIKMRQLKVFKGSHKRKKKKERRLFVNSLNGCGYRHYESCSAVKLAGRRWLSVIFVPPVHRSESEIVNKKIVLCRQGVKINNARFI